MAAIIEALTDLLVKAKGLNRDEQTLYFSDGEIVLDCDTTVITAELDLGLSALALDAVRFRELMQQLAGSKIELKQHLSKEKLLLKVGRTTRGELAAKTFDAEVTAQLKKAKAFFASRTNRWQRLPSDFKKGLELCGLSITRKQNTVLDYINIVEDSLYSSDNRRISRYKCKACVSRGKTPLLIDGSIAQRLLKFDLTHIGFDKRQICFKTADGPLIATVRGNYDCLNFDQHFNFAGQKLQLARAAKTAVSVTEVMLDDERAYEMLIKVNITPDGLMHCKGSGMFGWLEKTVKYKVSAKNRLQRDITFMINPAFFSRVLDLTRSVKVGADRVGIQMERFDHLIYLLRENK